MKSEGRYQIAEAEVRKFREDGYLAIDSITSADDVARLRESYDRIFEQRAGRELGLQFDLAGADGDDDEASLPQILQPARFAPEMNDSELLTNASALARDLLGPDAVCTIDHAILKPANHGAATPWHQDAAYWDPNLIFKTISIWVPLQDATLENGCMQFVPGSHKMDVLPHRSIGGDTRVHGLELSEPDEDLLSRAVACPIPAGGCTIHGGYMLHYASPNRSNQPRRALILGARVQATPRSEPRTYSWQEARKTDAAKKRSEAGLNA